MSITLDEMQTRTASLRRAFAGDPLTAAIGRGSRIYHGPAFQGLIDQLHQDPLGMDAIWQAWLEQLSMYGAALREKAEAAIEEDGQ